MLRAAADLLWPPRCAGCDRPGAVLCAACAESLPLIDARDACPRCGAPDGVHGCAECGRLTLGFTAARCACVLEWPASRMVTVLKDAGELRLVPVVAGVMAAAARGWLDEADAVTFAPASPAALARRGFDHTAHLAAEVAASAGLPALDALRSRPRRDQRGLSRVRRAANARASIAAVPGVRVPPSVVVVDDVMTTGATLDAAAEALREAGADRVRCLVFARACGGRL